jgi:RES domain-containing protein
MPLMLWRLSGAQHARSLDGAYGLAHDGRWNTAGHAVTYCATSPSLCILEKLVHVEDPDLLPPLVMVRYDVPDALGMETLAVAALPAGWRVRESWTQQRGDQWHATLATPLLGVPSVIVPLEGSPDMNVLINHRHEAAGAIRIISAEPFVLDVRLF